MHACLQIDEILRQIAVCAYAHGDPAEKMTVLSMAKTCHTFLEPTLDVLWRVQEDLLPLFRCFPRDLVQVTASDDPWWASTHFKYIWFKRPLQPSDFVRFQYHAKRIQSLGKSGRKPLIQRIVRTDALSALLEARHSPLLPNLRQLHWDDTKGNSSSLPYVHLFLGKNVTELTLTIGPHSNDSIAPFFRQLQTMNTAIQSFGLVGKVPAEARTAFSGSLTALRSLQRLDAPRMTLTDSALAQLSSLPNLIRVGIQLDSFPDITSFGDIPFPYLRELYVPMRDLRYLEKLLVGISSPDLKFLFIRAHMLPHPETLERVLSTIGNHPSSSSLENVTLRSTPSSEHEYALTDVMIRPLFSLKNLITIHLEILYTYNFNDALLNDMSLAWPLIEDVLLISEVGWSNCHVTLNGLVPFAVNCPKLKLLHVTVNAGTTPTRELGGGSPNHLITQLNFGPSIIAPPLEPITAFLSTLFPNLKTIQTGWTMDNTEIEMIYKKYWKGVEEGLLANIASHSRD